MKGSTQLGSVSEHPEGDEREISAVRSRESSRIAAEPGPRGHLAFVRGATFVFTHVYIAAAVAALVLYPIEAVAVPLFPGIVLALAMRHTALRASAGVTTAYTELKDLVRANVGIASLTVPLIVAELWFGASQPHLLFATCVLSALAVIHGAMMFAAFRLPAMRGVMAPRTPCSDC